MLNLSVVIETSLASPTGSTVDSLEHSLGHCKSQLHKEISQILKHVYVPGSIFTKESLWQEAMLTEEYLAQLPHLPRLR